MTYIINTDHTREYYQNEFEFIHRIINLQHHKVQYSISIEKDGKPVKVEITPKEILFGR